MGDVLREFPIEGGIAVFAKMQCRQIRAHRKAELSGVYDSCPAVFFPP